MAYIALNSCTVCWSHGWVHANDIAYAKIGNCVLKNSNIQFQLNGTFRIQKFLSKSHDKHTRALFEWFMSFHSNWAALMGTKTSSISNICTWSAQYFNKPRKQLNGDVNNRSATTKLNLAKFASFSSLASSSICVCTYKCLPYCN